MVKKGNSVLILSSENPKKLIAVYRPENQNKVCLPGGRQEPNESSIEGAIREVYEETGIVLFENELMILFEDFCISEGIEYWVTTYVTFRNENIKFDPKEENLNPFWIKNKDFLDKSYYEDYYQEMMNHLNYND
ncbi:NUDIX hydrolase [archaeon]|nr:NUDIX hydrolase [archaeon]